MSDIIFPPKSDPDMTDREWENYCIAVWCCNSLNAREGLHRTRGQVLSSTIGRGSAKSGPAIEAIDEFRDVALYHRAQEVIWFLMEETGRAEELDSQK